MSHYEAKYSKLILLVPLSENSTFSVPVLLRKDIVAFFQGSFAFSVRRSRKRKRDGNDHKKEESWTWHISPCHQHSTCSTALLHVSDHVLPPALSPGRQVSLSAQFYSRLLTGQAKPPHAPIKASAWVFKAKG